MLSDIINKISSILNSMSGFSLCIIFFFFFGFCWELLRYAFVFPFYNAVKKNQKEKLKEFENN